MPRRQQRITVYVADDHPVYRQAVARVVKGRADLRLVGEGCDGRDALATIREQLPDVAVLDLHMPGLDGLAVLGTIRREAIETRVVMLTGDAKRADVDRALAAGVRGFLSKTSHSVGLGDAIAAVARGEIVLAPEFRDVVAGELHRPGAAERPVLSAREQEVLKLMADGASAADVAAALQLSVATVRSHLSNLYAKLGVSDRAAAVAGGLRRGLIE